MSASDRLVLSRSRAVVAARAGLAGTDTAAYTVYLAVLTVLIVAVPLLRAVVLALAEPEILAALTSPAAHRGVGAGAAVLAACALLTARARGPVVPSPFLTEFLVASDLPRSITLRRPFLVTVSVLTMAAVTVTGLPVVAVLLGSSATVIPAVIPGVLVVVGSAAYAGVLALLWLVGQSCPRRVTTPLALVILAGAVVAAAGNDIVTLVTPWGWLEFLWRSLGPNTPVHWGAFIALILSSVAFLAVPALLNNLRAGDISAQSLRWQTVGTLVQTGDVAGAGGALRPPPTRGRRDRIAFTGPLPIAILRRDLGAARRFPGRTALGSLALVGAGWLSAQAASASPVAGWAAALSGALLAYLAVGVLCDGLRSATENAGPSSLYGWNAVPMICAHAILPGLACLVLGSIGAVTATLSGAPVAALPWWALLSVFVVLVRVLDCAKGPMPIGLLLPIVTPMCDVSILNVIAWQADAVLIVLAVAGTLTVMHTTAGAVAVVWLGIGSAGVAVLAARRIRALMV